MQNPEGLLVGACWGHHHVSARCFKGGEMQADSGWQSLAGQPLMPLVDRLRGWGWGLCLVIGRILGQIRMNDVFCAYPKRPLCYREIAGGWICFLIYQDFKFPVVKKSEDVGYGQEATTDTGTSAGSAQNAA